MDSRRSRLALGLALVLAVALAYQPAWRGTLLWDDEANVTSPELRSFDGLRRIWLEVGTTQQYFPVLHTAFWVEHRLWGDETLGYHLANIVQHSLSAVLLALILRRLAVPGAWLAAFVFALHPLHVESVAWITEQKNTLSGVFFLGAVLAWLRFDRTRSRRSFALALGLFLLALLSKTSTVPLFGVLLVIAWWQRGRLTWRRDLLPVLPFLVLGVCAGLFTTFVERKYVGATGALFDLAPVERLLLAGRGFWFYLGQLAWPADLAFVYPRWVIDPSVAWQFVFPAALIVLLACLWRLRRRTRGPLAGLLIFTGLLLPVLGVTNHYYYLFSFVANWWAYLASLGVIVLLSAGAASLIERLQPRPRLAAAVLCALLPLILGGLTWQRSRSFTDVETHYRAILADDPGCWMAHNNLGIVLADSGRIPEACEHYTEALRLWPDYVEAHNNLGAALVRLGRLPEAIDHYQASLRVRPDAIETLHNLGNVLVKLGRVPEAIEQYDAALRLNPDASEARNNLGRALVLLGRVPEAIAQYEELLARRPDFTRGHVSLGDALVLVGRIPEAIGHYQEALRLQPDDVPARRALLAAQQLAAPAPR